MLVVLVPLIGGTVAIAVWLTTHGMEWWWIALYVVAVILFIVLSFYAFNKVAKQRDELQKRIDTDTADKIDYTLFDPTPVI